MERSLDVRLFPRILDHGKENLQIQIPHDRQAVPHGLFRWCSLPLSLEGDHSDIDREPPADIPEDIGVDAIAQLLFLAFLFR